MNNFLGQVDSFFGYFVNSQFVGPNRAKTFMDLSYLCSNSAKSHIEKLLSGIFQFDQLLFFASYYTKKVWNSSNPIALK